MDGHIERSDRNVLSFWERCVGSALVHMNEINSAYFAFIYLFSDLSPKEHMSLHICFINGNFSKNRR